jgi:Tol biopolymer transport system component
MKPASLILLIALLGAAPPSGLPAGQAKDIQAEVALQAAIKTEDIDGDLKGAIEQYRKLADGGQRAVAAKALIRMGQCYEKLGGAQALEARRAYDRVVRDFADQKETVAAAQARLAALNHTAIIPALTVRRVWAGPGVNTDGAPSGDGRYLSFTSFTDRGAANIAFRNLATGEMRDLTKNSDLRQSPGDRSLFSPDGKTVAYTWTTDGAHYDVRLIGLDGSGLRVVFSDRRLSGIELGAWSPDGSLLAAALTSKDETSGIESHQIALISVGDGSARILKALGPRKPEPRGFSPDGRFIACDYPPREDADNRDIFLLATDGSQEATLVEHPADDHVLGWRPDAKGILFASDRTGPWGVWFLPVENGKPKGAPQLVKADFGNIEPLGFTRNGSYYYGLESGGVDAYTATLDPDASQLLTAPARIDERFVGKSQYPLFSPDGQDLAYVANRIANRWILCIRSLKTGDTREYRIPEDLERSLRFRWLANRPAILVSGTDAQLHHVGFYRIDSRTGGVTPILSSNPEADMLDGRFTRDGKSLVLARAGFAFADKASRILQRDLATGQEIELFRTPSTEDVENLALSPDGLSLAFTLKTPSGIRSCDELWIMSAQGANAHRLLQLKGRESTWRDGLVWTPDGRYLLIAKAIETSKRTSALELWRVPLREGEPHKVGVLAAETTFGGGSAGLSIHPDGTRIAFQAGRRKPEIWIMENVLPAPRAGIDRDDLSELTAEAWIKTMRIGPDEQTILAKGNSNYEGVSFVMRLTSQGKIVWGVRHGHTYFGDGGDSSIDGIVTDTAVRPDTWYHVAGTIYSAQSASVYVNGTLWKSGAITQSIPSRPNEPLHIGSTIYFGVSSSPFIGSIDDVEVYDRVLSPEEIRQRYLAGLPRHKNADK